MYFGMTISELSIILGHVEVNLIDLRRVTFYSSLCITVSLSNFASLRLSVLERSIGLGGKPARNSNLAPAANDAQKSRRSDIEWL